MLRYVGITLIFIGILSLSSQASRIALGFDEASNRSCKNEKDANKCGDHTCSANRGCSDNGGCECSRITYE